MTQTTYPTIREAFNNGDGDVFFKNQSGYIAVSRHAVDFDEMKNKGFEHVPYKKVIEIAAQQSEAALSEKVKTVATASAKKFVHYSDMEVLGYYDEFPDAYGQNL